jgi:NadR type nicotinamide-nucleotide adenylyltransferase
VAPLDGGGVTSRAPRPFVVVVTGSECTGKTTLAAELAAEFGASWSPEFVRAYVDAKRAPLDASDVEPIAAGQLAVERRAEHNATDRQGRLVVKDTDLVSTTVYARHYYGSCPEWIEAAARRRAGDLYLLLYPDVPWVPDGLQRDRAGEAERAEIHAQFRDGLTSLGARVAEINGSWEERKARAVDAVVAALEEA